MYFRSTLHHPAADQQRWCERRSSLSPGWARASSRHESDSQGNAADFVDWPLIQHAVDEAAAAGIEEIIFVTHRSKRSIEDHLHRAVELEAELASKGEACALKM